MAGFDQLRRLADSRPTKGPAGIVAGVRQSWGKVPFVADPYLKHLEKADHMDDHAHYAIMMFLAHANGWKGETAQRVKQELEDMMNAYVPTGEYLEAGGDEGGDAGGEEGA